MKATKYNSGKVLVVTPKDEKAPKRAAYIFRYPKKEQYTVRVFAPNGRIVYSMSGYNSPKIAREAVVRECYGLVLIKFMRPPFLEHRRSFDTKRLKTV